MRVDRNGTRGGRPGVTWRGRPILVSGSRIISCHCAIQPGGRPMAKHLVNMFFG